MMESSRLIQNTSNAGELGCEDGKTAEVLNGKDLEQEEKEFTCFWYTSRFNVRSQMGHKDHVRI